jgi:rhodanese-related sulfurtransferase
MTTHVALKGIRMKHISEVMNVKETIENISVEEAQNKLNDPNVQFIDVRDKETYEKGTIGNAINLERGLLEFYLADGSPLQASEFKEPSDKEYILLCNLGGQSVLATKTMMDMGISNVKNLVGGYTEWQKKFG